MGVAYDSFVMVLAVAGPVALVLIILTALSRYRTPSARRGPIQKIPLLLPAFAFIFTIIFVYNYVPLPMSAYRGPNSIDMGFPLHHSLEFTVYDAPKVYLNRISIRVSQYLQPDESVEANCRIYENYTLLDTIALMLYRSLLVGQPWTPEGCPPRKRHWDLLWEVFTVSSMTSE